MSPQASYGPSHAYNLVAVQYLFRKVQDNLFQVRDQSLKISLKQQWILYLRDIAGDEKAKPLLMLLALEQAECL